MVDDEVDLAEAVARGLRREGYAVDLAHDGAEAVDKAMVTPYDVICLDLTMPGLDGLEVCRRIRGHHAGRDVFVLIVTARDGRDDLASVLEAGADDYVTKPTSPENLRARLEIAKRRIAQDMARRTAEAELARSRWLAGIGETTIALEHEINNPLSALLGHAELLLMDNGLSEDQQDQLRIIQEQAARIARVVRRLARLKNPQSVEYLTG